VVLCGLLAVLVRVWSASSIVRRRARIARAIGLRSHRSWRSPRPLIRCTPPCRVRSRSRPCRFHPRWIPQGGLTKYPVLPSVAVCSRFAAVRLGASSGSVAGASWDDKHYEDPRISYEFVLKSSRPLSPKQRPQSQVGEWR
jgi:hypothetical protein